MADGEGLFYLAGKKNWPQLVIMKHGKIIPQVTSVT
jgi:hypothetical protein